MKKIVIIDYDSGNVASVFNALASIKNNNKILISHNIIDIRSSDLLILPGVGAFADCMFGLNKINGLIDEIKKQVLINKKSFLGICVGMQVLASIGLENGFFNGLNLIDGEVFPIPSNNLKIPHMGWNNIKINNNIPLLNNIKNNDHFYFANSYYFAAKNKNNVIAEVDYGIKIPAIINRDNIFGIQFHPEKSGPCGLQILKNFIQQ